MRRSMSSKLTPRWYGGGGPCFHSHETPSSIQRSTDGGAPAARHAGSLARSRCRSRGGWSQGGVAQFTDLPRSGMQFNDVPWSVEAVLESFGLVGCRGLGGGSCLALALEPLR